MDHILNLDHQESELFDIFKKIKESNTILFLGAGASIGEKKYLSRQLIEYYESYLGKSLHIDNITTFLDILSADESFSRKHFNSFVFDILKKLKVTEAHRTLATIPWREIITTNYDLLVETVYDELDNNGKALYTLKVIKSLKQLNYKESNTEIKYIKLNGCMSDPGEYPFAFSTDDFNNLRTFYKNVLNELKNLSPEISFLSIGYSYSDSFGKELLDKFDQYNFREKRWMINVDPYPNIHALPYYKSNKICIIQTSFQDFFERYRKWEQDHQDRIVKKKGLFLSDSKEQYLSAPSQLLLNLDGIVKQLNTVNGGRERFIKDQDFYKGEEPNFSIIMRGVDVVRKSKIEKSSKIILDLLTSHKSALIPLFFISGDFGIGKSTFSFRLVYELERIPDLDLVAFEILDFNRLKKEFIIDLIHNCKARNVLFFCDDVEVESYFKSLLDLQRDLSIEQFQDRNVFLVVPIRENILEKFKLNRSISGSYTLNLNSAFEEEEVSELLDKLKKSGLVTFQDALGKKKLIDKIKKEYNSDAFISLMAIITAGKHENDLIDSYHQLSPEAQKAFLFTALLHKHKLLMPAGWLKQNISMSWDDFTSKIVQAEGKGLLIQELRSSHGTNPDLYFRTKHPIIATKLVERLLPHKDKQYKFYEKMLQTIVPSQTSSYLANNLLKAFIRAEEYSDFQLNKLFNAAYSSLSDDPHFLLNYAINLQSRGNINDLKKALDLLIYAESLLEHRNHRFIHRRGVINFKLAKLYFESSNHSHSISYTIFYLNEAKELFITKQYLDPFSSFSYTDYIRMLIWELENLEVEKQDQVQRQIEIEELFDIATRTVTDGLEKINEIKASYANALADIYESSDYKAHLDSLYEDYALRPYACILLFNYFFEENNLSECDRLIFEMEEYQDSFEIVKFLFKFYGRNLHDPNYRMKLMRLSRENHILERDNQLRYNYFNFIAESYNYHFNEGKKYLANIKSRFFNLNPEFHFIWKDSNGDETLFEGMVQKGVKDKYKSVKILTMQQTLRLTRGNYDHYSYGDKVWIRIHFYLYGLMAEIVDTVSENVQKEEILIIQQS